MSEANVTVEIRDAKTGRLRRPPDFVSNRIVPKAITATAYVLIGGPESSTSAEAKAGYGYVPYYMALGTDSTPASDKDEGLGHEVHRNAITRRGQLTSKVRFQLYVLTTQANNETITEVGLFLPPTTTQLAAIGYSSPDYPRFFTTSSLGIIPIAVGTLYARVVIPAFAKTSADTMTITWDIPIANRS